MNHRYLTQRFVSTAMVLLFLVAGQSLDAADEFVPSPQNELSYPDDVKSVDVVLAGGGFWCTEIAMEQVKGVTAVVSGYAGGSVINANYRAVSRGQTEHAEAIQVTFDPTQISYGKILQIFLTIHDPTQLNRQGPDVGRQYRSAIFYSNEMEKKFAQAYIQQLNEPQVLDRPIVTTLEPLEGFFPAEDYHQDYAKKNPRAAYVVQHALPKVTKVKRLFSDET